MSLRSLSETLYGLRNSSTSIMMVRGISSTWLVCRIYGSWEAARHGSQNRVPRVRQLESEFGGQGWLFHPLVYGFLYSSLMPPILTVKNQYIRILKSMSRPPHVGIDCRVRLITRTGVSMLIQASFQCLLRFTNVAFATLVWGAFETIHKVWLLVSGHFVFDIDVSKGFCRVYMRPGCRKTWKYSWDDQTVSQHKGLLSVSACGP